MKPIVLIYFCGMFGFIIGALSTGDFDFKRILKASLICPYYSYRYFKDLFGK